MYHLPYLLVPLIYYFNYLLFQIKKQMLFVLILQWLFHAYILSNWAVDHVKYIHDIGQVRALEIVGHKRR